MQKSWNECSRPSETFTIRSHSKIKNNHIIQSSIPKHAQLRILTYTLNNRKNTNIYFYEYIYIMEYKWFLQTYN